MTNASHVVWQSKKDGTLRLCIDYSVHLKDKIMTGFPIARHGNTVSQIERYQIFCKGGFVVSILSNRLK